MNVLAGGERSLLNLLNELDFILKMEMAIKRYN